MTEVKTLIETWREVKEQLRVAHESHDKARAALSSEDADHVRAVSQWDDQKMGLSKAIAEIKRAADEDKAKADTAQREADAAMTSAVEARSRNEEHRQKLSAHLQNLHAESARIEMRDSATAQQLLSFRVERERTRSQLVAAIQKLEETIPQERESTAQQIRAAAQRTTEARQALDADTKAWNSLVAKRKRTQHAKMVEAVEEEMSTSIESRQKAKMSRAATEQSVGEDRRLLARIRSLRGSLTMVA